MSLAQKNPLQAALTAWFIFPLALAAPVPGHAQLPPTNVTTINVNNKIIQSPVKRFGVNLGGTNYYDSGQMLKNLIVNNPGFEGEIAQSMIECGSGTATSCTHSNAYSGWAADFWDGATYEIVYGHAIGRKGTISTYTAATTASASTSPTGGVFNFSDSGTTVGAGDYMIVRKPMPGNATDGWTTVTHGYDPNRSDVPLLDPAVTTNSTDLPPGTAGIQTAYFHAPLPYQQAILSTYFDSTAGRTFVQLNGQYELSFKAKGLSPNAAVSVRLFRNVNGVPDYINKVVPLTSSWQNYTITFTGADNGSVVGTAELDLSTVTDGTNCAGCQPAAAAFYLDDVSLVQLNTDPANATVFRDPVVKALKQLNPGVIRFWFNQLGESLDNLLAPTMGRQRSTYSSYTTDVNFISYGLTDFLQLCQTVGADPWVVVPITLSNAESSNLIDYLAGDTSTKYGALRAASGQTAPWTSVFHTIHLEFGNEAWDQLFNGGDMENFQAYGTHSNDIFAAMRANSAFQPSSFDLIINGIAAYPFANTTIQYYCTTNDSFAAAPYLMYTVNDPAASGATGTQATNENLFGSAFAEAEAFVTNSGTAEGIANGYVLQDQLAVQASGRPKPFEVTEFNISPRQGTITQDELNALSSSIGGGLAVMDGMLQQLRAGVSTSSLFQLAQYRYYLPNGTSANLFGAVVDMGVTDLKRPQFLAEAMVNSAIGSFNASMLETVHTGADPTWNQPLVQTVQLDNAHYLQSFAFSNGTQSSLIVFNTNRTTALPVAFAGQRVPAGTVQIQQLTSANITDTNETSSVVAPVSSTLSSFNPSSPIFLPPFSMTILSWTVPVISGVTVSTLTSTSATISWNTNVAATGLVNYGTTTSYGSQSASTGASTTQSVTLTGLTPGQTYNFSVSAVNSAGAAAGSPNATFTTPGSFTISAPASISMQQGQQNSYLISVTPKNGFSGTVALSLSGLPTGATGTFQPSAPLGYTLTIQLPANATVGTYPLTLTASAGQAAPAITTPVSLIVTQSQPVTINLCASENGTCTVPTGTTATVYYGAGGTYLQRTLSGTFSCSAATFGSDPAPNLANSCYLVLNSLPAGASACAIDNGTCTLPPGTSATVYYGAVNSYVYKTLTGTFSCSPGTFGGDPLVNVIKSCYPVNIVSVQSITFSLPTAQIAGSSLTLTASATSGLPVTFASTTTGICTVTGTTAALVAAGTCTITASQAGNAAYAAASVSQSITVTSATPSTAMLFIPVPPFRAADTRNATILSAGTSRNFTISGSGGIPASALAYAISVTVMPATTLQSLTVYPAGGSQPALTFMSSDGRTKTQSAIIQAGTAGAITVSASNSTHVILDVTGYFVDSTNSSGLAFYPITPARLFDTRINHTPLVASQTRNFAIQSTAAIPAGAQAYSLNFTVVPSSSPVGNIIIWPTGQPMPGTSALSTSLDVTANAAIVGAGTGGSISVNSLGNTDILVDINGYWAPPGSGGLSLYPITPVRFYNSGTIISGTVTVPPPASSTGIPATAQALVTVATVTPPSGFGYLTLWPAGTSQPDLSTLNAMDGAVTSNLAIVGATSVAAFATNPTLLTLDAYGYFAPAPSQGSGQSQTITFGTIAAQTVGTPLTLNATASSGLAVTYSSSTTNICTVSGSTATFLVPGTCTLTASQSGNTIYAAAVPVSQSFSVTAVLQPQTITFGTITAQTVGTPLTLNATASSGLAVTYSSSTTSICTVTGSIATFLAAGTCTLTASQTGNSTYAAAVPVSQSFNVSAHTAGQRFIPLTPFRLVDTRNTTILSGGTSRSFTFSGIGGIPATGALAYSLNVTIVPSGTLQSLTVYPTGQPQPALPLMSSDGRTKAQAAIVQAGTGGAITVAASNSTQVIIDVNGYFVDSSNSSGLAFYPVTPKRLYDTRTNQTPLAAFQTRNFAIQSTAGIPANAQAYSLNFTVVPSSSVGFIIVWPTGQPVPATSTLNTFLNVTANAAIVGAGTGGSISVYSFGNTDLIIDITGYWAPPGSGGLSLYPVTPVRVYNSATTINGIVTTPAPNVSAGIPATAQSLLTVATVTPPSVFGYLTLWPAATSQPNVSTLNAIDGAVTSNLAIIGATQGSVGVFASNPTVLTLDAYGYFAP